MHRDARELVLAAQKGTDELHGCEPCNLNQGTARWSPRYRQLCTQFQKHGTEPNVIAIGSATDAKLHAQSIGVLYTTSPEAIRYTTGPALEADVLERAAEALNAQVAGARDHKRRQGAQRVQLLREHLRGGGSEGSFVRSAGEHREHAAGAEGGSSRIS
eukprot:6188538-Pleurochrysis_carterae.AAC.4